jgi:hypothetical protein
MYEIPHHFLPKNEKARFEKMESTQQEKTD